MFNSLFSSWLVVLNDFDVIKEALVSKGTAFAGRVDYPRASLLHRYPGIRGMYDRQNA